MSDYRDKLDEWRDAARRKARELDEKYGLKERVEETARAAGEAARAAGEVAQDAARRGAEVVADGAERARVEAERLGDDFEVGDRARRAAEDATRAAQDAARAARGAAREAGETFRNASRNAGERAGEVFDKAKKQYERASHVYDVGARLTRLTTATSVGLFRAVDWVRANPGRAVLVSLSVAGGVRLGASFPALDGVLLGAHPHWFTHSALPVWALQRAGKKFDSYLRERERLIREGELAEAERKRVEFERKIVRYVGAPLLGAFSCAAGVAIWAQIMQPGHIAGAPISWLLGGNPFLEGIWLFSNGVICFQQGYKFFMIALNDQQDVERIVREIRGLLPAAATA
ncbi:MAG TPA: hypothetical protein VNA19_01580 [Pyrinomonadaceae bacterium]|jgi:hypothetical protein|nr:hypothetical protein [Pyrinomonadaceae bacterium]